MRLGMVIDLKRCIGCYACVAACRAEKATSKGILFSRVEKLETGKYPAVRRISLPLLCMHCRKPACMEVCPTGATKKQPNGIVWIDKEMCIGCRYCMDACPYAARLFNDADETYYAAGKTPYEEAAKGRHQPGTVEKCDFCMDRVSQGQEPACVANCITKARAFGDLDDPRSQVSRLIRDRAGTTLNPEFGTEPSVFYLPP